jgi:pyridoxine/pyridoxamine 5'-phosphate oxidase
MFTNAALQFQQMRKQAKRNEEAVLTSMAIAKHDFQGRSLRRLKLILRLEHSI